MAIEDDDIRDREVWTRADREGVKLIIKTSQRLNCNYKPLPVSAKDGDRLGAELRLAEVKSDGVEDLRTRNSLYMQAQLLIWQQASLCKLPDKIK